MNYVMKTLRILYGWVLMYKHQDKHYQRPLNTFFENIIPLRLVIIRLFRPSAFRKDAIGKRCVHSLCWELFDLITARFSVSWLQGFTLFF